MDTELDCLVWGTRSDFITLKPSMQHSGHVMTFIQYTNCSNLDAYTLAMVFHDHYERSRDSLAAIKANRCAKASTWYDVLR